MSFVRTFCMLMRGLNRASHHALLRWAGAVSSITNRAISGVSLYSTHAHRLSTAEARGPHSLWLHSLPWRLDARPPFTSHTHAPAPHMLQAPWLIIFFARPFPHSLTLTSERDGKARSWFWLVVSLVPCCNSTAQIIWPHLAGSQWTY